jgi:hypothetical protein
LRQRRAAEIAGLDPGAGEMAGGDVIIVRAIVDQRLPVDRLEPFHRPQCLHAAVPAVERGVQIPARVAEVGLEARGVLGPGREDDAGVSLDAGLDQTEGRSVERVVIGLPLAGDMLERAVVAIGPAVIGAGETGGVSGVGATHPGTAVPTDVQECIDSAIAVAHDEDRVLAHIGRHEVARMRDLCFMTQEEPAAREDPFELLRVDLGIDEDPSTDKPVVGIDQPV